MSLLSVFLGREIHGAPGWTGCEQFGQFDAVMNSDDIEAFVDKQAETFLEEELKKMPGFRAISVPGDGNCLAHAVSKSVVGVELLYHALRKEIQSELRENQKYYRQNIYPFFDDEEAAMYIEEAARQAVPLEADHGGGGMFALAEFLGPLHIHAMANVLRRPIILMARADLWEAALSGVYLPARLGPVRWTEATKQAVSQAIEAALTEPVAPSSLQPSPRADASVAEDTDGSPTDPTPDAMPSSSTAAPAAAASPASPPVPTAAELEGPLREWHRKVLALEPLGDDTTAEALSAQAATVGELTDALADMLRGLTGGGGGPAWKVYNAIAAARVRTPLFISWSGASMVHFVCLLPAAPGGKLADKKIVLPREAIPSRDGQIVVMGEGNSEASCAQYIENGEWAVRGNVWPHREKFMTQIEEFWRKEHPEKDFRDEVVEKGWNLLLPNLLNNVLDVAQLFKSLNADDDEDPVWIKIGVTRVLAPRRIRTLSYRLPGLYDLLQQAADRMRPIWITHPDMSTVMTAGTDYVIKWGTLARIAKMVEKACGIKLEDQKVEIGWMFAGTGDFKPNIAKETAFHERQYTWSIPMNFKPGAYWIAVRLLPFHELSIEGAGPPAHSFRVIANPDAPTADEPKPPSRERPPQALEALSEEATPRAPDEEPMDVDSTQASVGGSDKEKTPEWEFFSDGYWQEIPASMADRLERSWLEGAKEVSMQIGSTFAHADLEQMKIQLGMNTFSIHRKGSGFTADPEALASLLAMGFSEKQAVAALEVSGNDPEMAAFWLMDREDEQPEPETRADMGMPQSPKSRLMSDDEDLDLNVKLLPAPIQRVLSREVSGISPTAPISILDPTSIPEVDMEREGGTPARPVLDESWLMQLEREASGWKMQREINLFKQLDDQMKDVVEDGIQPPVLTRSKTDAQVLKETPKLARVSSAPPVMSGLSKEAWATLWKQARAHYSGAPSS